MKVWRRWTSPPLILVFLFVLWPSPGAAQAPERPIHAAIAAAGANHSHLLSQIGSRPISRRQGTIIAVAAAIGFGVGYGAYYFENRPLDFSDERAHAMASGTFGAVIAGVFAWAVVA